MVKPKANEIEQSSLRKGDHSIELNRIMFAQHSGVLISRATKFPTSFGESRALGPLCVANHSLNGAGHFV